MKKLVFVALAAMALIVAVSTSGHAFRGGHGGHYRHGGHVGVGIMVGPGWGPWWGGGPYYPYPYYPYYPNYPYYPYYAPPVVIEKEPDTYIQQTPQSEEPIYWYFCKDPEGYYPNVKKCPKGWLKVVPPSEPTDEEE